MNPPAICVVMNAGSGRTDPSKSPEAIRDVFNALGSSVELMLVKPGDRIEAQARSAVDQGYQTIVAAGGDGTICAVAAALNGSGRTMGILPLGTFNYFARSLDLPERAEEAAKIIVQGRTVPLRVGMINDRVFLNNASLGAYPAILETREQLYKRWGRSRPAAYWSVLKTLARLRHPMRLQIEIAGARRDIRSPLVFIVNNAFQLKQMALQGAEQIAAGELVVFIAPDSGRLGLLRHALALAAGRASPDRNFEMLSGSDISIVTQGRKPTRMVARDGEREHLRTPFRLRVLPDALKVIVPADYSAQVR